MDRNGEEAAAGVRFASAVKNSIEQHLKKFGLRFISESLLNGGTRDSHYELKYIGQAGLVMSYYIFEFTIGIGLVQLENGNFPEKYAFIKKENWGVGIMLNSLIKYKVQADFEDPLPNPGPKATIAEIKRAFAMRQKALEANLEGIVTHYMKSLALYGADILQGDLSYFGPVQDRYTADVKKEYSWGP